MMSEHNSDSQALSEVQLRQIYDEEEVERFMFLFSAYVTEIRLSANTGESHIERGLDTETGRRTPNPPLPRRPTDRPLSEYIAHNYVLPYLPPAPNAPPAFTLRRFTLTIQRLYLAMFPPYHAFLSNLARLALWKDYQRSLRYCVIFWFLWFHDLLLPAVLFRVVFTLLRRRLSTHPTLRELQERRQDAEQAVKFGEAVQQRLSVTTIGPIEMWRLFKVYKSEGKDKASVVKNAVETDDEETLKRDVLFALNELADLHERIKNVFTWRRPDVSRRYLIFFIVIGLGTLVIPTRWIVKMIYWLGGTLFWHVTPVIAALRRADRARVSALFKDAPTDADYAMELIAKRIATGQEVDIASLRNQSRRPSNASTNTDDRTLPSISRDMRSFEEDGINWKKWGERAARGKLFVEEGRRFLSTHVISRNETREEDTAVSYRETIEDAHTFLAQYTSFPGLITLTPSTLFFTSFTGTHARLVVPRDRLRGVRRSGLMKGISITWVPGETMDGKEREDKFHWVGNRDELFARLVGSDGRRWIPL